MGVFFPLTGSKTNGHQNITEDKLACTFLVFYLLQLYNIISRSFDLGNADNSIY